MLPSIPGYDSWKLASPDDYDNECGWEDDVQVVCKATYEDEISDEHKCVFDCHPDQNIHQCDFAGTVTANFFGDENDPDYFWDCPTCGAENEGSNNG